MQSGSLDTLPENIVVDIKHDGTGVIDYTTATLKSHAKDQTETAIFEYSVWANLGEKLTFVPWDSRYIYINLTGCSNNFSEMSIIVLMACVESRLDQERKS